MQHIALSCVPCQGVWLICLLKELVRIKVHPVRISVDNKSSAIELPEDQLADNFTKHTGRAKFKEFT